MSPSDVFTPAHRTFGEAVRAFFAIRSKAEQPFPFPHKMHIEKKAVCTDCHESVEKGPIAGIPSVKTCMICHCQIATDRPLIKQVTDYSEKGHRDPVAARLRLHARGARALQSRAAHPRQGRLRDLSRRPGEADGRASAPSIIDMGFCVNCHQEKQGVERLPDLSLLMLTAR